MLSKRAHAFEALKEWDSAAADWSRAAGGGNGDGAKLLADFARRLAANDQVSRAKDPYDKSQALYESSLGADPDNELIARELAQSLLDREEDENDPHWTVLQPSEIKSKGGATLTKLDDQSVLSGGENPDKETFTFVARTDLPKIRAVRLEALHARIARRPRSRSSRLGQLRLEQFYRGGTTAVRRRRGDGA